MSRFKEKIALSVVLSLYIILASEAIAWENQLTHPAITQIAAQRSVLEGDYLQTQMGLNDNLDTQLELTGQFQNNINMRVAQEPEFIWDNKTKISILEWLRKGSSLEDVPNPRARHHFYDPIRNTGLNNSDANPDLLNALWLGSKWFYPDYWGFNATGLSDLDRAKGLDGDWGNEYLNYYNWVYARGLFYAGLTEQSKVNREADLGSMFVTLGHICHLLEDMGVPAHTRNDFVMGHLVGGFYKDVTGAKKPFWKGGHAFEAWMETQVQNNSGNIPNAYLDRLMATPPAFSKLNYYWDTGICEPSGVAQWQGDSSGWPGTGFGNPPPEKSWGLAECSNYQFLSYSTVFKNSGLQSFPHPAKEHTRVDWYPTGPDGERQYYRLGYDVPHLARVTYTTFYAWIIPIYTVDTSITEEERVYEDYAKRTISRTVDYTTGLLNYFFRGKLSIDQTDCNNGKIVITITNKSTNSDVNQILKGGTFKLYWDDSSGNRTAVSDFNVYRPGTEPGAGNEWNSDTQLAYDESTKAVLTLPESSDVDQYILVYEGIISADPNSPDSDDTKQIATTVFTFDSVPCDQECPSPPACMCATWTNSIGSQPSYAKLTKDPNRCCWTGVFMCGEKKWQSVVLTYNNKCSGWQGWYGTSNYNYLNNPIQGYNWSKTVDCNGGTVQLTDDVNGVWEKISFNNVDCSANCNSGCACDATGYCSTLSNTYTLTISGMGDCSGGLYGWDFQCHNFNGTYVLTRNGNSCFWYYDESRCNRGGYNSGQLHFCLAFFCSTYCCGGIYEPTWMLEGDWIWCNDLYTFSSMRGGCKLGGVPYGDYPFAERGGCNPGWGDCACQPSITVKISP